MDIAAIRKDYPAISAAANEVLGLFGPALFGDAGGSVETDISAAASLAGLMILRNKGFDLREFRTGTVILSDLDTEMAGIWAFMTAAAGTMGLDPSDSWDMVIPEEHLPVYTVEEMTQKTEPGFLSICGRYHLTKEYYPYIAVLAALKLVVAADAMKILDQKIGKALTGYHVVKAAKTVPYPVEK